MRLILSLTCLLLVVGCTAPTTEEELVLDNATIADGGRAIIEGASEIGTASVEAIADNVLEIGAATKGPVGLGLVLGGLSLLYWKRRKDRGTIVD